MNVKFFQFLKITSIYYNKYYLKNVKKPEKSFNKRPIWMKTTIKNYLITSLTV